MMRPELIPTCGSCGVEVTPDDDSPCERDWLCRSCWETCQRCKGDECGHEGGAA